jgi:hypothetical protein
MSFKTVKECTTLAMTQGNRLALCVLQNKMLEGITKSLPQSLLVNGGLHDFEGHFFHEMFQQPFDIELYFEATGSDLFIEFLQFEGRGRRVDQPAAVRGGVRAFKENGPGEPALNGVSRLASRATYFVEIETLKSIAASAEVPTTARSGWLFCFASWALSLYAPCVSHEADVKVLFTDNCE